MSGKEHLASNNKTLFYEVITTQPPKHPPLHTVTALVDNTNRELGGKLSHVISLLIHRRQWA